MFSDVDFQNGVVTYCETEQIQKEDLLQVVYDDNILLDVGWYAATKAYHIYVIVNNDWERPKITIKTTSKKELCKQLQTVINDICSTYT